MAPNHARPLNQEVAAEGQRGRTIVPPIKSHRPDQYPSAGPPVKTCRMQDVVLLPFPLTDLYGGKRNAKANVGERCKAGPIEHRDQPIPLIVQDGAASISQEDFNNTAQHEKAGEQAAMRMDVEERKTAPEEFVQQLQQAAVEDVEQEKTNETTATTFKDGTTTIPEEIKDLCRVIDECKKHTNQLPIRVELKKALPDHFNHSNTMLKKGSLLLQFYGDTRLFSKEVWIHLTQHKARSQRTATAESTAEQGDIIEV